MVYSVLLDKGTGSEVTSPTSHLPERRTHVLLLHGSDPPIPLANPVLCHGRRLMLPAHDRSTKRDSQLKRCSFHAIETVNLKSR